MTIHALQNIVADPVAYARSYRRASGKKIIGTVCSYVPEEIILAAGAHPIRLLGEKAAHHHAGAHLQAYCCSLVRGILEEGLSGRSDDLDGVVFSHTCDSMQRLSDIWRLNVRLGFHLDTQWPVKLHTRSAQDYALDVLAKFRDELGEALKVEITDEALKQAVVLTNRIRRALQDLYRSCQKDRGEMGTAGFNTLVRASMIMDRKAVASLLEEEASRIKGRGQAADHSLRKRLFILGSTCNHTDIYPMIAAAGGVVVGDDLCTGARYFAELIDETVPAMTGIAERLINRPVCPAKHAGLESRAERLLRLVTETKAQGVVFLLLKFCDPHAFDYPYLKAAFDAAGVPCLLLEMDDAMTPGGQLSTRLEAFLEML